MSENFESHNPNTDSSSAETPSEPARAQDLPETRSEPASEPAPAPVVQPEVSEVAAEPAIEEALAAIPAEPPATEAASPPPEPPLKRKRLAWGWVVLIVLLVLALAAGGGVLGVRAYEDNSLAQAQASLANKDWTGVETAVGQAFNYKQTGLLQKTAQLTLLRAQARYQLARYDQALNDLDAVQTIDPQRVEPYYYRTLIYLEQGKTGDALAESKKIQERDDRVSLPYALQALDAYQKNQYKDALAAANSAIEKLAGSDLAASQENRLGQAYFVRGSIQAWQSNFDLALADLNRALEINSKDVEALAVRVMVNVFLEQYDGIKNDAAAAAAIDPKAPAALWAQAMAAWADFDDAKALELVDQAIQASPTHGEFYLWRGRINPATNQKKSILADYDRALELNPNLVDAIILKASLLFNDYDQVDIAAETSKALALAPNNVAAHRLLARWYSRQRQFSQAQAEIDTAISLRPTDSNNYIDQGEFYFAQHLVDQARTSFQKAQSINPKQVWALADLARLADAEQNFSQAEALLDQALAIYPTSAYLHAGRARVFYDSGESAKAQIELEKAVQLDPDHPTVLTTGILLKVDKQDFVQALSDGDKLIALYPNAPASYTIRSHIYMNQDDPQKAQEDAQKAIGLDPYDAEGYRKLADALISMNKMSEGITAAEKAITLEPWVSYTYSLLGSAYLKQSEIEKAIQNYQKALELEPENASFQLALGMAQSWSIDDKNAIRNLQEALDKGGLSTNNNLDASILLPFLKKIPPVINGQRTWVDTTNWFTLTYPVQWVARPPEDTTGLVMSLRLGSGNESPELVVFSSLAEGWGLPAGTILTPTQFADEMKASFTASSSIKFISRQPFPGIIKDGIADQFEVNATASDGSSETYIIKVYLYIKNNYYDVLMVRTPKAKFNEVEASADQIAASFDVIPAIPASGSEGSLGSIKIATQTPLSGSMAATGVDIKNGAELALAQLSAPLEKMGFTVELVTYDDKANADVSQANAFMIDSDPAVLCVVGHYNSGIQIPTSEFYHLAGLAEISPATTNPKVTGQGYPEVSRIVGRDDMQGVVAAQFASQKGITSAYVLHDNTSYGQGVAETFRSEANRLGLKVLGFVATDEKVNFEAILAPLLSARPGAVYLGGLYDQWAPLIKQAREKGYLGMFLTDDGFDSPDSARIAGDALTQGAGTYFTSVAGPAAWYPGAVPFQADFKAKYNHSPYPFAAQGYDAMGVCLKAIENAARANANKLPDRAAVAKAVRTLKNYVGITGLFNFNSNGDLAQAQYFVVQVTEVNPILWANNKYVKILYIAPPQ